MQVGFARCETVAIPSHASRGFQRPLQVFSKVNSQSQAISAPFQPIRNQDHFRSANQKRSTCRSSNHTLKHSVHFIRSIHTPFSLWARASQPANQKRAHASSQSETGWHARSAISQAGIHHREQQAARPIRSEQHTHKGSHRITACSTRR